ncbi:MAG: hypothetical protein ABR962_05565 [Candidatus Bathyarchaeia archaeon]
MSSRFGSVLLKIGGLGYFLGFVSWFAWAVLAVLSLEGLLLYNGDFRWMSGVYFQAPSSGLIFYGLLSLSLLFSAIGCFALSRKQNSWLAFVGGVVFVGTFVSVMYGPSFAALQYYEAIWFFQFPLLFFLGLILWGATLLSIAGKIGVSGLGRVAGILFVFSGVFGMLLWRAILYWGFEFWLLGLGWLYAVGALMSALILFRISRMVENPKAPVAR